MNGFELHGIKHTSPSSINTWVYSKRNFILQKLFQQKTPTNAAMQRGIVIENAVVDMIMGRKNEEQAYAGAVADYNKALLFSNDNKINIEREIILPSMRTAMDVIRVYGQPEFFLNNRQHKIEIICNADKWKLPVIGYLDLFYPKHKIIIDIKTTNNIPDDISAPHRRQGSVYKHAYPEYDVHFLYIDGEDYEMYEVGDHLETMIEVKNILLEQEEFLSSSGDREILLEKLS